MKNHISFLDKLVKIYDQHFVLKSAKVWPPSPRNLEACRTVQTFENQGRENNVSGARHLITCCASSLVGARMMA